MKYISLDIETTGLNPATSQVLQVSMVVENTEAKVLSPVQDLPTLDLGLWATHYEGDAYALGMNEKLIHALNQCKGAASLVNHNGRELSVVRDINAWGLVAKFIYDHFGESKGTVCGKNVAGFDMQFMPTHIKSLFRHQMLEVGSIALGAHSRSPDPVFGCSWEAGIPSMKDLLGFEPPHDALLDARHNISVMRSVTNWYGRGPGAEPSQKKSETQLHDVHERED